MSEPDTSLIETISDLPLHGGDLAAASVRFGIAAEHWLDLSTGINPLPYPLPELDSACWQRLPGSVEEAALRAAAAACYRATDPSLVVPANGTQAIIQALPRLFQPLAVTVLGPTYGEHARAWSAAGHTVTVCHDEAEVGAAQVVVVVNPNNPDGRRLDPDGLLGLARALHRRGGLVVVDEAFADVLPEISVVPRLCEGLVVLRSFGKFFGLAGMRLGFAITTREMAAALRAMLGPWCVSGPAMAVATQALLDRSWINSTRSRLTREAAALDGIFHATNLTVVGGCSLFRLVTNPRAVDLYRHLGRHGILVRAFAEMPDRLRFGPPGNEANRQRLRDALAAWREQP